MAGRAPIRKVKASGVGGLAATLLVAAVQVMGAGMPEWVAAVLVAAASTLGGYAAHSAPGEPTAPERGVPERGVPPTWTE